MKFKIVLYKSGRGGSVYSLQDMNKDMCELELALREYEFIFGESKAQRLALRLKRMIDKFGFDVFDFKNEGSTGRESIFALNNTENYRFYLYFETRQNITLAGGGVKLTRTYQDDHKLYGKVKMLKSISRFVSDMEINIETICKKEIVLDFDSNGDIINLEEINRDLT